MNELVKDKVIIVTGGAGLLGKTFCQAIADNGGIAVVAEYDITIANKLCASLENTHIVPAQIDITNKASIEALIVYVSEKYGKIDALVNSAYPRNKNYGKHFFEVAYTDFCENVGMNLVGYFLTSQQFEVYDNTPMTTPVEYAAIKSGLIHLTKYMAKYFKGKNIRVNAISLGGIEDKQPESFLKAYKEFCLNKGMLDAKDIAGTVLYLLSDLSEFVNGQNIVVDDGFTL